MSKKKFFLMIACISLLHGVIKAQTVYFYGNPGEPAEKADWVLKIDGNQAWFDSDCCGKIRRNLAQNEYYYEYSYQFSDFMFAGKYEYVSSKSTSTRDVYCITRRFVWNGMPARYRDFYYIAISKDKSSIIMWHEDEANPGQIDRKSTLTRIPKEDLLPKATNYDFLNE